MYSSFLNSQTNYVYNGDFELFDTCPDNLVQVNRCLGWKMPTNATSDYLNTCAPVSSFVSIPSGNPAGYQDAYSGNGYMGFIGYYTSFPVGSDPYLWVEYIQGNLIQTLEKDALYKVEYFLNFGNYSNVSNRNIGVYLSDIEPSSNNTLPFYFTPQVSTSNYIFDTLNWTKVTGYFISNGSESKITIGCFYQENIVDTLILENNAPQFISSYYLIDNLSITKSDFKVPNVISINNDGVNDFIDFTEFPKDLRIVIVNRWGNKIFDSNLDDKIWKPENQTEGVYFYTILNKENKNIKTGFIHLV